MNHDQALQLQAAEKYVLGELPQAQREEYEEHYFDCSECAQSVKALASFVDTAREVLRLDAEKSAARDLAAAAPSGWFRWLRPAVGVPVFAALLLVVAYQNTVTIPQAKKEAAQGAGQLFTSSFSLQLANVRGGEEVKVQIHPNESFALRFDFTPTRTFDSYVCQLQDASGRALLQESIPGNSANKEAQLAIRGGLMKPGKYSLVFTGAPGTSGPGSGTEVLRLGFSVEFLQ